MDVEVATVGERGQVVIPQSLRDRLGVHKGDKFMVLQRGDMFVFKKLQAPSAEDFDRMLKKAHEHARKHELKPIDVEEAIQKARSQ